MSRLTAKFRAHLAASRRARAIDNALSRANSPDLRTEIETMTRRGFLS
jgi:hypothetical protein